jgi:hypothetical protein
MFRDHYHRGAKYTLLFSHGNAEDLGMVYEWFRELSRRIHVWKTPCLFFLPSYMTVNPQTDTHTHMSLFPFRFNRIRHVNIHMRRWMWLRMTIQDMASASANQVKKRVWQILKPYLPFWSMSRGRLRIGFYCMHIIDRSCIYRSCPHHLDSFVDTAARLEQGRRRTSPRNSRDLGNLWQAWFCKVPSSLSIVWRFNSASLCPATCFAISIMYVQLRPPLQSYTARVMKWFRFGTAKNSFSRATRIGARNHCGSRMQVITILSSFSGNTWKLDVRSWSHDDPFLAFMTARSYGASSCISIRFSNRGRSQYLSLRAYGILTTKIVYIRPFILCIVVVLSKDRYR